MIYERIKELCRKKGISINQLETDLGFAKGSLSKIDKSSPSAKRLSKLSHALDTTPEYLLTGKKDDYYINPDTAKVAQEIFENKELRLLFDAARDAKPEDLETTRAMLLALKRKEMGE